MRAARLAAPAPARWTATARWGTGALRGCASRSWRRGRPAAETASAAAASASTARAAIRPVPASVPPVRSRPRRHLQPRDRRSEGGGARPAPPTARRALVPATALSRRGAPIQGRRWAAAFPPAPAEPRRWRLPATAPAPARPPAPSPAATTPAARRPAWATVPPRATVRRGATAPRACACPRSRQGRRAPRRWSASPPSASMACAATPRAPASARRATPPRRRGPVSR